MICISGASDPYIDEQMRYIIRAAKDKDESLRLVGSLLSRGLRDIVILYRSDRYLEYIQDNILQDFGESVFESGSLSFVYATDYRKRKDDKLLNPADIKDLEKMLK